MNELGIKSPAGRQPGENCQRVATELKAIGRMGGSTLSVTSLVLGDHPDLDLLEATFEIAGGEMSYTFDCSRPATELLSEFRGFARQQLTLHGDISVRAFGD